MVQGTPETCATKGIFIMKFTKLRLGALIVAFALAVPALAVAVSPFVDVIPGKFYEAPVNWAASNGITTGSPSGSDTFKPDNPVTRGENVTFLKRYDDNIVQPADAALGTRIDNLGQTVGTLNCTTSQVARWNGTAWVCNTVSLATALGTDAITSVDTGGGVGADTSITIGADGLPIISYRDGTNQSLKVFHCANVTCTTGTATTVDTGGSNAVGFTTSIAIGADGLAIISYFDLTGQKLKVVHCANTTCTAATNAAVATMGIQSFGTSIAIGANNFPIIGYQDITTRVLNVFRCTNTTCTTGTAATLDPTGGMFASLSIGADGFPIISHSESIQGPLKVFHCTDAACTAGTSNILDNAGGVSWYTSITIGADGLPIISYFDAVNSSLKVFHCANTACTGGTATTLNPGGTADVGTFASITIGADNLPIVSYLDSSNGDLKVAHLNMVATGLSFG